MNYNDFKSMIGEFIQNPDALTEKADGLLEEVKLVFDTADAQAQEIEALKSKNNDLRDTNVKLLMRQSFEQQEEEEPVKSKEEILQDIINKIKS